MDSYEAEAFGRGCRKVAGVDEVGRGPLAGPVVAAAVILKTPLPLDIGIRDSKALSPRRRFELMPMIFRRALSVGTGIVWPGEIDAINIHNASLKAMRIAVSNLKPAPDAILVDGRFPIDMKKDLFQKAIVKGDAKSITIAAASIVAKTMRDRIMASYHELYPCYGFLDNMGYPTPEHLKALLSAGPSPIHRLSFRGVVRQEA